MEHGTYQTIRYYCWQDIGGYIDTPNYRAAVKLRQSLTGRRNEELADECRAAMALRHCKDLTPREGAAANLLAVISNHRAITWHREPVTPDGREPAAPLEPHQAAALRAQTTKAIAQYATHIPEHAAILVAIGEELTAPKKASHLNIVSGRSK